MAHTAKSPPAATGGTRKSDCLEAVRSENSISQRLDAIANAIDPLAVDLDIIDALVQLADEIEVGQ